jgi:hypothetical protein
MLTFYPRFGKTFPINVPYLPPILTIYNATTTKKNGLAGAVALTCENCVIGGSARVQGAVDYSIGMGHHSWSIVPLLKKPSHSATVIDKG